MSTTTAIVGIALILLLIAISGFFSSSELAVFSIPAHRLEALLSQEVPGSESLAILRRDPPRFLTTVLVSNNVSNIAAASIATAILVQFVSPGAAATVATITTSFFIIILGEIAPKSYAVAHAERHALRVAHPVLIVQRLLWPVFYLFERSVDWINLLTGGAPPAESSLSREEIELIVLGGAQSGALDVEESTLIQSVLELEETVVRALMVPRASIVSVSIDDSLETVIEACWRQRVTRVPVIGPSLDDIRGIVDLRDALRASATGEPLEAVLTEVRYVPSSKPVDELLTEMQAHGHRMVIVVDEFGTVVGVATLEDVIEEVVGEFFDHDETDPVRIVDETTAISNGWAPVSYVNEVLGTSLETDGPYVSIAGLVNHHLGRIAEEGDRIELETVTITVLDTTARRIRRVRLDRVDPATTVEDGMGPPMDQ